MYNNYLFFVATLFFTSASAFLISKDPETVLDILEQKQCLPHKTYTELNVFCICNENGTWPNEKCKTTFGQKSYDENIKVKTICEPNSYVTIECNVCKCNDKGEVDNEHCTKNICENETEVSHVEQVKENDNKTRRLNKIYYENCKPNTFYAMGACKFCFCSEKYKLVCKETGPESKNILKVGKAQVTECATDIKKDIDSLVRDQDVVYKPESYTISTIKNPLRKPKDGSEDTTNNPGNSDDDNRKKKPEKEYFTHIPFEPADRFGRYAAISGEKKYDDQEENSVENQRDDDDNSENKDEINDFGELEDGNYNKKKILRSGNYLDTPEFKNKGVQNILHSDVPVALRNYVIRRAIRRNALMRIVPGKPCEPGTEFFIKCNVCFCLKNGSTLCTKKICRNNK